MHWCPDCGDCCFCDCDDLDWGDFIPDNCPHECIDYEDNFEEQEDD